MKLDEIKELHAYQLARLAECGGPNTSGSPGAVFLEGVRDDLIERLGYETPDEIRDGDGAHEIADAAPDVYTARCWAEFADLAAWTEDPSEYGSDGSDMTNMAGACLYAIAHRLVLALLGELGDDDDDDTDEDTEVE